MEFAYVDISELFELGIGFGLVVVLPIIGLLLAHQRKMAVLVRTPAGQVNDARLAQMQAQIDELRIRQADLTLALDDARQHVRQLSSSPPSRSIEA